MALMISFLFNLCQFFPRGGHFGMRCVGGGVGVGVCAGAGAGVGAGVGFGVDGVGVVVDVVVGLCSC